MKLLLHAIINSQSLGVDQSHKSRTRARERGYERAYKIDKAEIATGSEIDPMIDPMVDQLSDCKPEMANMLVLE